MTTTEIAIPEQATVATTGPVMTEDLHVWAERLRDALTIGTALSGTSFVPSSYQGKPQEAAAAILYGYGLGFDPTQSLQSIAVIKGKPSLYARSMVALVVSRGHKVWTESKSDDSVTVCGQRAGSDEICTETWTYARAEKAKYTSSDMYQKDPQAMLYARAASTVCRQIAPDVLLGVPYSREEMDLTQETRPSRPGRPAVAPQQRRSIQEAAAAVTRQEPPAGVNADTGEIIGEIVDDVVDETPTASNDQFNMVTNDQLKEIAGIWESNGNPKEDLLPEISARIGREITQGREITATEAVEVIAHLNAQVAA